MANSPKISIITPCYNPPQNWADRYVSELSILKELFKDIPIEFILVNDGSDALHNQHINGLYLHEDIKCISYAKNQGKGYAIREGVKSASGSYIIYTDIDFPFGTEAIKTIYEQLRQGHDLVIGKRANSYFTKLSPKRRFISAALMIFNRIFLPRELSDTQAGIKGFKRHLRDIFLSTQTNSFVFEIEFLLKIIKKSVVRYTYISVEPKQHVTFTDFSDKILFKEVRNLATILAANSIKA